MAEQELPGGWLPPQAPGGAAAPPSAQSPETEAERPSFVQPRAEQQGTNTLAVAALVCAISSIGLLVFSLGLSFMFSLPLGVAGWVCAAKAPRDVQPGQRKAGLVLAIAAVALSVAAAVAWIILIAAGFSVDELQRNLENELERQRRAGS